VAIEPLLTAQDGQVPDIPGSASSRTGVNPPLTSFGGRARVWESSSGPCCVLSPQPAVGDAVAHAAEARDLIPTVRKLQEKTSPSLRRVRDDAPFATLGRQDTVLRPRPRAARLHPTGPGLVWRRWRTGRRSLARVLPIPDVSRGARSSRSPASASASKDSPRTRWSSSRGSPTPPRWRVLGLHSQPRQQGAVDGDDGTRRHRARARSSPARPGALVGAACSGHGPRRTATVAYVGQRLERGHRALSFGPASTSGRPSPALRDRCSATAVSTSSRKRSTSSHLRSDNRSRHRPPSGRDEGGSEPEGQPGDERDKRTVGLGEWSSADWTLTLPAEAPAGALPRFRPGWRARSTTWMADSSWPRTGVPTFASTRTWPASRPSRGVGLKGVVEGGTVSAHR